MARLQKKCFVFSVGVHVLLLLVLVLGPAFRTPPERPERLSQISLVSASAMETALARIQEAVLPVTLPPVTVTPTPAPQPES